MQETGEFPGDRDDGHGCRLAAGGHLLVLAVQPPLGLPGRPDPRPRPNDQDPEHRQTTLSREHILATRRTHRTRSKASRGDHSTAVTKSRLRVDPGGLNRSKQSHWSSGRCAVSEAAPPTSRAPTASRAMALRATLDLRASATSPDSDTGRSEPALHDAQRPNTDPHPDQDRLLRPPETAAPRACRRSAPGGGAGCPGPTAVLVGIAQGRWKGPGCRKLADGLSHPSHSRATGNRRGRSTRSALLSLGFADHDVVALEKAVNWLTYCVVGGGYFNLSTRGPQ